MADVKVNWNEMNMDYFKVKKVLVDMLPVFSAIGMELLKEIGKNFDAEGIWKKWAPMRPGTKLGRRQGSSSKLLAASGRMRASFRSEPMKSYVRVGSPMMLARLHHEGRKGPWTIAPRHAKALAFPSAGGASLKQRYAGPLAMIRGKNIQVVRKGKPGQAIKVVKFQTYAYHKRSKAFMSNVPMAVVLKVRHPGYPSRPLLPPDEIARRISAGVVGKMLEDARR
jgi:phage gpG-like protein